MGVGSVIESLSRRMARWYEEEMGMEPSAVEVTTSGHLLFVRFKGVITPSEANLSLKKDGKDLLREINERMCEGIFPRIKAIVKDLTGCELLDLQVESNLPLNERIYVLTLNKPVDEEKALA